MEKYTPVLAILALVFFVLSIPTIICIYLFTENWIVEKILNWNIKRLKKFGIIVESQAQVCELGEIGYDAYLKKYRLF